MSAIDYAIRHFADLGIRKIEVSEWVDDAGRPLVIYAKPLNVKQKDKLAKLQGTYGRTIEWCAHVLIRHALNAQGEPLFTLDDLHDLTHRVSPEIIDDIASKILITPTVAEEKKS